MQRNIQAMQKQSTATAPAIATQGKFSLFVSKEEVAKAIQNALPDVKAKQRFTTAIISAVANNPALENCEHATLLSCFLLGEAMGFSHSKEIGQYYVVPYDINQKDKNGKWTKKTVAQFQLGYKGYIQLAIRSGQYKSINVVAIKEGEFLDYNPLTEELTLDFIKDSRNRAKAETVGYYASFTLLQGFTKSIYWTKEEVEEHALTYSKSYQSDVEKGKNSSFWSKNFDAMAFKTVLKQLLSKWGILSLEIQTAVEKDSSVMYDNETIYVDNSKKDDTGEVFEIEEAPVAEEVKEPAPAPVSKPVQAKVKEKAPEPAQAPASRAVWDEGDFFDN